MKKLILALSHLAKGISVIFDFAGFLQDENLHEKHDASAIRKDWSFINTGYSKTTENISGRINGLTKQ